MSIVTTHTKGSVLLGYTNDRKFYIDEDKEDGNKQIVTEKDEQITPVPYLMEEQRVACFISGMSGSGKSTIASKIAKELQDRIKPKTYTRKIRDPDDPKVLHPARMKIVLITGGLVDPAFKQFEDQKRLNMFIPIHPETDPSFTKLSMASFIDTIVIFDDFENIKNERPLFLNDFTRHLLESLLKLTRKQNTHILVINHATQDYVKTKTIINECDNYVLFPSVNRNSVRKFLDSYGDLSKDEIEKLVTENSKRFDFLFFHKSAPRYALSRHRITVL